MSVKVPKRWPDSTIACLATGPSLVADDVNVLRGRVPVIVVNDAVRLAPWADVLYACDPAWWRTHRGVKTFSGLKYSVEQSAWSPRRVADCPDVVRLKDTGVKGLETDPSGLRTGQNSGYQAINLAVHLGARRIVLLGYDMQRGADGRTHWFGHHPSGLNQTSSYAVFRRHFETMVAPLKTLGVEVINCSRETALTCFPRMALAEALALPKAVAA